MQSLHTYEVPLDRDLSKLVIPLSSINAVVAAQDKIEATANLLLSGIPNEDQLIHFYKNERLLKEGPPSPMLCLAALCALSRLYLLNAKKKSHLSVVVPLYNEISRMKSPNDNPNGENLIVNKIRQLDWLTTGTKCTYSLLFVDDGCPYDSGKVAKDILLKIKAPSFVSVQFLKDAFKRKDPPLAGMQQLSDSARGGAILWGLWHEAQQKKSDKHVILYTDSDLSMDLRMSGLAIHQIVKRNKPSAIGTRYKPGMYIESEARKTSLAHTYWTLRLTSRVMALPEINRIYDVQVPFKAFRADVARQLVSKTQETGMAMDVEILLHLCRRYPKTPEIFPVVCVASEAESASHHLRGWKNYCDSMNRIIKRCATEPEDRAIGDIPIHQLLLSFTKSD